MINESKGTPNIVREIINDNHVNINRIIYGFKNDTLNLEINKSIKIEEKVVNLKCKLKICFQFTNSNNYNGDINFEDCINSNFEDCKINIYIPKDNINKLRVYKSISHELTHLYELYQIRDTFDKSSWVKSKSLNTFDGLKLDYSLIRYFRDIFYASLQHEIRANLSSIEVFLIGLNSKDESYIRNELYKTSEWSRYKAISDFNPDIYVDDLLNTYGLSFVIRIFNLFNKLVKIEKNITNKSDLLKYFKSWKKYLTKISKNYISKIDDKIKDILEVDDNSNKYTLEKYEDVILSYSDYLNDASYKRHIIIDELLKIDYLSYFKK